MKRKSNRDSEIIIEKRILMIRGEKVLLDSDLAELYSVETGMLTRAVRRNIERFPEDFMFQLTKQEFNFLKSQTGISSRKLIKVVLDAIRQLMTPPEQKKKKQIGFIRNIEK